jgi:alkylhydroperoxidase family enzyme
MTEMRAALEYTRKLSLTPESVQASDIEALRTAGFCDKGISYIIQIAASFGYWARMINGLGNTSGGANWHYGQSRHINRKDSCFNGR